MRYLISILAFFTLSQAHATVKVGDSATYEDYWVSSTPRVALTSEFTVSKIEGDRYLIELTETDQNGKGDTVLEWGGSISSLDGQMYYILQSCVGEGLKLEIVNTPAGSFHTCGYTSAAPAYGQNATTTEYWSPEAPFGFVKRSLDNGNVHQDLRVLRSFIKN